jgi:hypothetical protein
MLGPPKPSQPVCVPGEESGPGSSPVPLLEVVEVLVVDVVEVVDEVEEDVVEVEVLGTDVVFDVLTVVEVVEVGGAAEVELVVVLDVDVEVPVWVVTGAGAL